MTVLCRGALGICSVGNRKYVHPISKIFCFPPGIRYRSGLDYKLRIREFSVFAEENSDKPINSREEADVPPYPSELGPDMAAAPERTHD